MSMSMNTSAGGRSTEMNVTPLIDVLLVLLIIFMLMPPKSTGLETLVPQPQPSSDPPPPANEIILQVLPVTVGGRPALKINHENVTWEGLHHRLQVIFASSPSRVLFVKGDTDLDFRCVAEAIDIARSAGIEKVGLVTRSMDAAH